MRRAPLTAHCLLITSFLFLLSCSQPPAPPAATALLLYNFEASAFIEYTTDFQPGKTLPFSPPPNCGLTNTFPAPLGPMLLIELDCPDGPTVLLLDTETATVTQPFTAADAYFLAWTSDSKAAYLKADALGAPRVIRIFPDGAYNTLALDGFTYDLAARPESRDFTFTLSRGLGYGSELSLARNDGRIIQPLYTDPANYISFARWSPDGSQIAFLKTPDSQIPFTVGELWVMNSDGSNPRKLANADAGHGYAANWSPDGTRLAFVVRENPDDASADQASEALVANLYLIEPANGQLMQLTQFTTGYAETPHWSPDGNLIAYTAVLDGRMSVIVQSAASAETRLFEAEAACCAAWMRK